MGATTPTLTWKNKQTGSVVTMSAYCAGSDAIGVSLPITAQGIAAVTSPREFTLPPGIWTLQYQTGPATGRIRLWCNGVPGPINWDLASVIAMVATGNTYGAFRGGPQFVYQLKVDYTLAA